MNYRKKAVAFVAVSLAAGALLASGSGAASATVFCKTSAEPCTSIYPVGTKITGSLEAGTEWVLKAGFATVKCKNSAFEGEITEAGGSERTVTTKEIIISEAECNCTVTTLETGGWIFHYTTPNHAIFKMERKKKTINCSGVSCNFGGAEAGTPAGVLTEGSPAHLNVEAKLPYVSGDSSSTICTLGTGTGTLTATYVVTTPNPLFVAPS
jgi:hypothetical protein